jgi:hypothetical protein
VQRAALEMLVDPIRVARQYRCNAGVDALELRAPGCHPSLEKEFESGFGFVNAEGGTVG